MNDKSDELQKNGDADKQSKAESVERPDQASPPENDSNTASSVEIENKDSINQSEQPAEVMVDSAATAADRLDLGDKIEDENIERTDTAEAVRGRSGGVVSWLVILLVLVAVVAAAYTGWISWQQRDDYRALAVQVDSQQRQMQHLQGLLSDKQSSQDVRLNRELKRRDQQLAAMKESLVEAQLSLDAHSRRLLSLTATTTDDWRVAEVEYLLRLANQRILISKDSETALSLLTASDQILLELADPRLFKVREAIANDRAAIAIIGKQDLEGAFLELSAISKQVDKLPFLTMPDFVAVQSDHSEPAADSSALPQWLQKVNQVLMSTWRELKSLVVIQQIDKEIKPLLPPEHQFYLRNNLKLLLSQAQLALLDGRQASYRESLNNAARWLETYFPQGEEQNRVAAGVLKRLATIEVDIALPDVSDSLLAIKAFIAEQHRISQGHVAESAQEADSISDKGIDEG